MDIRDALNSRGRNAAIAVSVVLVLVAGYLIMSRSGAANDDGKTFFTVDDGKSYIAADAGLIPPCMIAGKTAVFAYVYRCPTCGKQFVGNMGRYQADRVEALKARLLAKPGVPPAGRPQFTEGPGMKDLEMKRPGEPQTAWKVPVSSVDMATRMKEAASGANVIHCPDHRNVVAEPVMP